MKPIVQALIALAVSPFRSCLSTQLEILALWNQLTVYRKYSHEFMRFPYWR